MRNWDFETYQKEIKNRTKGLKVPRRPDKDVRDRDPYESEALAKKVREAWQRDLDRGVLVRIPGGYKLVWQKTIE